MKKRLSLMVLAGIFISQGLLSAFAQQDKRQSRLIRVQVGEVFVIALDSNRTTGYEWQLARSLDKEKLTLICTRYKKIVTSDRVGVGGEDLLLFKAIGPGKTTIVLKYARPRGEDKRPLKKKSYVVIIEKPTVAAVADE